MICRTYDAYLVSLAVKEFLKDNAEDVDPIEWLSDPDNIVLQNDKGDVMLFEHGIRDIYSGHYFFKSRGRQAIQSAIEILDELFNTCYNIPVIMGLVPLTHLGARWLTRHIGFKSYGVQRTSQRPYELFIITKEEFNESHLRPL